VMPGQTVALVGPVGSGKTTLMNLVPRLLEAGPGQVLIDGHPITDIRLDLLRSSIGYVRQETFLFSGTIASNLAYSAEAATRDDIEGVATAAAIADEIAGFPHGYDTVLGERGVTLSGGQKQRASIARALLGRPRILLLDDALASVDAQTEEKILQQLRVFARGSTCLIASHRLSTIRHADLIVVLDDGRIAERGTHAELLASGGMYSRLYKKQSLEKELDGG